MQRLGRAATTVKLTFQALEKQDLPVPIDALNMCIYDTASKAFVGASYRVEADRLQDPFIFQGTPKQVVAVELLARDTRPTAPLEEMRVTHFATCTVEALGNPGIFSFRPGNAHLMLLEQVLWPPASRPSVTAVGTLTYQCDIDKDAALSQLMNELVPPGVFVSEAFTMATPQPLAKAFHLHISQIEISATSADAEKGLGDPHADWAVAAVAHNGYQQLSKGVEVPLAMKGTTAVPKMQASPTEGDEGEVTSSSYSYSYSDSRRKGSEISSSAGSEARATKSLSNLKGDTKATENVVLHSELPVSLEDLPVHSTTSLVLAIRRRAPDKRTFAVVGFCVFPLCMMPMKNRDIRVENLPALRGPFSCEDARMLMVDASTPYGRVPISMTLTVEYHDVEEASTEANVVAPADLNKKSSSEVDAIALPMEPKTADNLLALDSVSLPVQEGSSLGPAALPSEPPAGSQPLATSAPPAVDGPQPTFPLDPKGDTQLVCAAKVEGYDGVFKLLCSIMEELAKVRETQDAILRQVNTNAAGTPHMSPDLMERLNNKLADGPIDLIDLAPRPLSISWATRRAIQDNVQPILHPTRGGLLDENVAARGSLPSSLFGVRLEGITLDTAIAVPLQMCLLFSFGPLPCQQVGPMILASVHKHEVCESFKIYDGDRGGFVWCEPVESLEDPSMHKFKECGGNATVYLHVYDAVSMFYVATAALPLTHFHRPFNMEASVVQMDLALQRDFSLTEHVMPAKVFPVMRHAGQLHVSLFCVGVPRPSTVEDQKMLEPAVVGRVVVAKKLAGIQQLQLTPPGEGHIQSTHQPNHPEQPTGPSLTGDTLPDGMVVSPLHNKTLNSLHWQRAEYVKQQIVAHDVGSPRLPGVPGPHLRGAQLAAEMEYKLRLVDKMRSEAKEQAIARAIRHRLSVSQSLVVTAWRPQTVRTPFQNPHSTSAQFSVEVTAADAAVCSVAGANTFYLGPRERTEVELVVRCSPSKGEAYPATRHMSAKIVSERREVVRCIELHVTMGRPCVDRRYEIYGPAGAEVTKRLLSRTFASSSFPITSNQSELLQRMSDLCGFAETSSERTKAETSAVVDPITQSYVTAWEEVAITTTVPKELGRQRLEYLTLFYDADRSRVYETWELCVFACECLTTREIPWGQTTALGFPSEGTTDMYCSQADMAVERVGTSYVVKITPRQTGTQRMMLHTLQGDILKKTLITVPVGYPTPSFTQVIELSMADVQGPVFRRLLFVNRNDFEDIFHIHHNYKFQLQVSPKTFALAPQDSQYISLQFNMLVLPPGQLEGRWPMWIFINNSQNKTVESYYLQVVLRVHPVVSVPN